MILKYKKFNEVSGTELIGNMGPGYGDIQPKNNTISTIHTNIYKTSDKLITWDQYQEYINIFLKNGGLINQLSGDVERDVHLILKVIDNK
jgi:hypothetical protein